MHQKLTKIFFTSILFVLVCIGVTAQEDKPSIKIEADSIPVENRDAPEAPAIDLGKEQRSKKLLDISKEKQREINMLPENKFGNRGAEIEKKYNKKLKGEGTDNAFAGNQNLGSFSSNGKFVKIICRDHEYVDGDRIRVYVNGIVVQPNILLDSRFRGFDITLEEGFNKIDFEALNEGTSSPNTAEFHVFDDNENLVSSNRWLLKTGFKATIVIVKEKE